MNLLRVDFARDSLAEQFNMNIDLTLFFYFFVSSCHFEFEPLDLVLAHGIELEHSTILLLFIAPLLFHNI